MGRLCVVLLLLLQLQLQPAPIAAVSLNFDDVYCTADCQAKARNGRCDKECNTDVCLKDLGECEDRTRRRLAERCAGAGAIERPNCTAACVFAGRCERDDLRKADHLRQIALVTSEKNDPRWILHHFPTIEERLYRFIGIDVLLIGNETHPAIFGLNDGHAFQAQIDPRKPGQLLRPEIGYEKGYLALFELMTDLPLYSGNNTLTDEIKKHVHAESATILYLDKDQLNMEFRAMNTLRRAYCVARDERLSKLP